MSEPAARADRLRFLDGLRGYAALAVALEHIYNAVRGGDDVVLAPSLLHWPLVWGGYGVAVFFVLSGCVISYAVGSERIDGPYVLRFIARRFVRLDIPYWACIAAYLLAAEVAGKTTYHGLGASGLASNLLYANFALGIQAVVQVGWTLAIEVQFYLAYVLMLWAAQALERAVLPGRAMLSRAVVFAPAFAVTVLWQLKVIPDPSGSETIFLQPWLFFLCGAALTWTLFHHMPRWPAVLSIAALATSAVVTGELDAAIGSATALGIWAVALAGKMGSLGVGKLSQWLGGISYSLYLTHPLFGSRPIRFLDDRYPLPWSGAVSLAAFLLALGVSLVAGWLFCVVVERPAQRLARRIPLRPRASAPVSDVALLTTQ